MVPHSRWHVDLGDREQAAGNLADAQVHYEAAVNLAQALYRRMFVPDSKSFYRPRIRLLAGQHLATALQRKAASRFGHQ